MNCLPENGRYALLFHINSKPFRHVDVEQVYGDTLNPTLLEKAFSGADVVFNLAGKVSVVSWK
jgi:nucleoside-diphosphate-sugar epimerase